MVTSPNQQLLNRNTSDSSTMKSLTGWKEISTYLRRGVRTVQRWESLGLPVHRIKGGRTSPVFAFAEELDAWAKATPTGFLDVMANLKAKVEFLEIEIGSLRLQLKNERQRSSLKNQNDVRASRAATRARLLRSVVQ